MYNVDICEKICVMCDDDDDASTTNYGALLLNMFNVHFLYFCLCKCENIYKKKYTHIYLIFGVLFIPRGDASCQTQAAKIGKVPQVIVREVVFFCGRG